MNGIVEFKPETAGALALAKEGGASLGLKAPFATEIILHEEVCIAGTTHVADIERIACDLHLPQKVQFQRDPNNPKDKWAIKVLLNGQRIGFVPADINEVLARLMDGGKLVEGTIVDHELRGRWHRLVMNVSLSD